MANGLNTPDEIEAYKVSERAITIIDSFYYYLLLGNGYLFVIYCKY